MKSLLRIFWLGTKELRAVLGDPVMSGLILFVFTVMVYSQAAEIPENLNNASIAIVDEDNSPLSREISEAFYPPFFQRPDHLGIDEIDIAMDRGEYLFSLVIPPRFEADLRKGLKPEIQLNIDATAVLQAGLGDGYIQSILSDEISRHIAREDVQTEMPITLVLRRAFNENGTQVWFSAMTGLLDFLSMVTILLTGAALIREREHGTIEHLLVMPLTAFEIAAAKIWANGLIIIGAFTLSLNFVVKGFLNVPIAGSEALLIAGTGLYLFAAAAIGILLGTMARTMAQFALMVLMIVLPMMMLSGGMSPIESQPAIVQPVSWLLPSRHYMAFAQAVAFRGAGISTVWPELLTIFGLGAVFLTGSLARFRNTISS